MSTNAALYADPANNEQVLTIVEENIAPTITLSVSQDSEETLLVSLFGGDVIVSSTVTDPNMDESFSYEWSFTNSNLDITNSYQENTVSDEATFTFDPAILTGGIAGIYEIKLSVTDVDGLNSQVSQWINVSEIEVELSFDEDSDGDDCLKLTLVDGGIYDADQIANDVIVDTGVISIEGIFVYLLASLAFSLMILIPLGARLV